MASDEPIIDVDGNIEKEEQPTNESKEEEKNSKRSKAQDHFRYVQGQKKVQCPYCKKLMACNPRKKWYNLIGESLRECMSDIAAL